ncbi:MAG: insulinase family protein, partial [Planctomycetes bacterium]|nr:insulinase family protein [Planctomycetota bacterium]
TDLVAGTISADLGIAYFGHAGTWTLTKATAFKPNEILVQLRLQYPAAPRQAGVAEFAERAFLAGGLGKHSAQELSDILAGSTVRIAPPRIEDDGVVFTASCLPSEFELCLQQLNAYLTDPGWRSDGEATAKSAWLEELKAIGTNLDAQVGRTFQSLTVGGAPGRRQATLEEAQAVGFAQVRAWLEPILRSAPLTLSVVGDLDADGRVLALLHTGAYFNGPRSVEVVMTTAGEAKRMAAGVPMPTGVTRITVPGTVPRALILVAWPTADFYDIARTRRLGLLAQVFTERMRVRIRQELGDAYSPFAHRMASEVYRGEGYLMAEVGVAPEKIEEARATVLAIAQELVDKGVGTDLLAQVKPPVVKSLAAQRQQNQYWLGSVLSRAMTQPFRIDWATTMEADYASITALDLSQLAKQYLIAGKALQVVGVCTGK